MMYHTVEPRAVPLCSGRATVLAAKSTAIALDQTTLARGSGVASAGASVALEVASGFKSIDVVEVLTRVVAERGKPRWMRCDNELRAFVKDFEARSIVARRREQACAN